MQPRLLGRCIQYCQGSLRLMMTTQRSHPGTSNFTKNGKLSRLPRATRVEASQVAAGCRSVDAAWPGPTSLESRCSQWPRICGQAADAGVAGMFPLGGAGAGRAESARNDRRRQNCVACGRVLSTRSISLCALGIARKRHSIALSWPANDDGLRCEEKTPCGHFLREIATTCSVTSAPVWRRRGDARPNAHVHACIRTT